MNIDLLSALDNREEEIRNKENKLKQRESQIKEKEEYLLELERSLKKYADLIGYKEDYTPPKNQADKLKEQRQTHIQQQKEKHAHDKKEIIIYTDGSCLGNPGKGGWGVYMIYGDHEKELYGGEVNTTNNRMEMQATIEAMKYFEDPYKYKLVIHTDSSYVQKGITQWMKGWKANNWRTSAKKPVKNVDLWQQIDELIEIMDVDFKWVKGHNGNHGNEKADELANKGSASV